MVHGWWPGVCSGSASPAAIIPYMVLCTRYQDVHSDRRTTRDGCRLGNHLIWDNRSMPGVDWCEGQNVVLILRFTG